MKHSYPFPSESQRLYSFRGDLDIVTGKSGATHFEDVLSKLFIELAAYVSFFGTLFPFCNFKGFEDINEGMLIN